ncbi:MAG: hypothetical protein MRY74_13350 [Neomegalonema sp.]|nr:hypothetical protein [Neomegalonema sp.]
MMDNDLPASWIARRPLVRGLLGAAWAALIIAPALAETTASPPPRERAVATTQRIDDPHGRHGLRGFVLSADGRLAASYGADGRARLWRLRSAAATGAAPHLPSDHSAAPTLTADGALLATLAGPATVQLTSTSVGWAIRKFSLRDLGVAAHVNAMRFSRDGKLFAIASSDGAVRIWDVKTGALRVVLAGRERRIALMRFSPGGGRLLTADLGGALTLWDVLSGAPIATMTGHIGGVRSAEFSMDGARILSVSAGASDPSARIWDAASGAQLLQISQHGEAARFAGYIGEAVLIVSASGQAGVWDGVSGKRLRAYAALSPSVSGLALCGRRNLLVAARGRLRILNVDTGADAVAPISLPSGDVAALRCAGRRGVVLLRAKASASGATGPTQSLILIELSTGGGQ